MNTDSPDSRQSADRPNLTKPKLIPFAEWDSVDQEEWLDAFQEQDHDRMVAIASSAEHSIPERMNEPVFHQAVTEAVNEWLNRCGVGVTQTDAGEWAVRVGTKTRKTQNNVRQAYLGALNVASMLTWAWGDADAAADGEVR